MQKHPKIHWLILSVMLVFALQAATLFLPVAITAASGAQVLKAEDKDGLPVPANYTNYSGEKSAYMQSVSATTSAALKTVIDFYRRELKSRKWNELPGSAGIAEKKATLLFVDGKKDRLILKLIRNAEGGTDINAAVKLEGDARKDGVLPAPGKARIYLGNMTDAPVVITINQKKVTLKKQSTNDGSMKDAPFVEVPPGKHPYTLTMPGQAPMKDTIEVGADETWGLIAGPGGAMPLQMY